jgi:hypothetical protein
MILFVMPSSPIVFHFRTRYCELEGFLRLKAPTLQPYIIPSTFLLGYLAFLGTIVDSMDWCLTANGYTRFCVIEKNVCR